MTPNFGYDPTDPRAQQQANQGQRQPPQQRPQGQGQPPQQGRPPQGVQGQAPGQPPQSQQGGAGPQPTQLSQQHQQPQGGPQAGPGPSPRAQQSAPPAGGMGAPGPQQRPQPGPQGMGRQRQQGQFLEPVTIDELVTEDVVTAKRDTPIRTAVAKMAENDVGSVVVVEDDQPVGLVTDRKVALALEDSPDITQRNVDELVGDDVMSADPSMTVFDLLQLMSDEGIRRIPVVDENGSLQGIVTLDDALVFIGGELGQLAQTVEAQIDRI